MGVGVGEASLSPAAYSLISDSFPRHKLATAISVYSMGIYLGTGLSYLIGGLLVRWIGAEPTVFTVAMPFGVAAAAIQEMMLHRMRGQASAIYLFVINLIGLGLGPSMIAWVTDYVLIVTSAAHVGSAILLWLGIRQFQNSLLRLDRWESAPA